MKVIPETRSAHYVFITITGGLLVSESIIRPVGSASKLTWFIRYTFHRNLQFPNRVFIIKKSKALLPQV